MALTTVEILIRLVIALLLGSLVGAERTLAGKTAGMRTYALVAMGSALFALVSILMGEKLIGTVGFNPMILGPAIISGIGNADIALRAHSYAGRRAKFAFTATRLPDNLEQTPFWAEFLQSIITRVRYPEVPLAINSQPSGVF